MKITAVTTHFLGTAWRELRFFKVETCEDLTGWGEVRPLNKTEAIVGYLRQAARCYAIGRDSFNTEQLVYEMVMGDLGRPGEIAMSALACLEIACWDIKGQALYQPVYRLIGGAVRGRIKPYAKGWPRVERTPAAFAEAARAAVDKGYRVLKFDPFGGYFFDFTAREKKLSIRLAQTVRGAVSDDIDLLIEMHGRFTLVGAIEMAREPTSLPAPVAWARRLPRPQERQKLCLVRHRLGRRPNKQTNLQPLICHRRQAPRPRRTAPFRGSLSRLRHTVPRQTRPLVAHRLLQRQQALDLRRPSSRRTCRHRLHAQPPRHHARPNRCQHRLRRRRDRLRQSPLLRQTRPRRSPGVQTVIRIGQKFDHGWYSSLTGRRSRAPEALSE